MATSARTSGFGSHGAASPASGSDSFRWSRRRCAPMCFNTGDPVGVAGQPFGPRRLVPARLERLVPRRVTRRHVIGGALAVGAGVSALRLLSLDRKIPSVRSAVVPKSEVKTVEWTSPLAQETARIAHLLRRATFGAGPDELEAAFNLGYGRVVDKLVETPPAEPPAVPGMNA